MSKQITLARAFPWILIIGGIIGLVASFTLTAEHIHLIEHPNTGVSCDLNPIVSCGAVIKSGASSFLGIPNPVFGVAAFSVLITLGVLLLAGSRFQRWIWLGLQAGATGGVLVAHYFFYETMYVVNAICPWCMVTDATVIILFWYTTLYNVEQCHIPVPAWGQKAANFTRRHHVDIVVPWPLALAAIILNHFWYYFGKHLPF
jgi:uncharacterized membrane protein